MVRYHFRFHHQSTMICSHTTPSCDKKQRFDPNGTERIETYATKNQNETLSLSDASTPNETKYVSLPLSTAHFSHMLRGEKSRATAQLYNRRMRPIALLHCLCVIAPIYNENLQYSRYTTTSRKSEQIVNAQRPKVFAVPWPCDIEQA